MSTSTLEQNEQVSEKLIHDFSSEEFKLFVESTFKDRFPKCRIVVKTISPHYYRVNIMEDNTLPDCVVKSYKFVTSCMVHITQNGLDMEMTELLGK
jgi:hypothetical protein